MNFIIFQLNPLFLVFQRKMSVLLMLLVSIIFCLVMSNVLSMVLLKPTAQLRNSVYLTTHNVLLWLENIMDV